MRRICVATAVAALGALTAPGIAGLTKPAATQPSQINPSWEELQSSPHRTPAGPAEPEWSFVPSQADDAVRAAVKRPPESHPLPLREGPVAPLPPPMLIGPLGIGLAAWTAYRAKKRGGRI